MHDLQLVGFTTDRRGLIFRPRAGARSDVSFVVPVTDELVELVAGLAQERADAGPEEPEVELDPVEQAAATEAAAKPRSQMSVRDIQARLRAGEPVARIAVEAGVDEDWIERFAPPIRAEQRRIVDRALAHHLQRSRSAESAVPLRRAVGMALADKGIAFTVAAFDAAWSAHLLGHDRWVVEFTYRHRGRDRTASWTYDADADALTTSDRTAAQLGYVAPGKVGTADGEAIDGIIGDPEAPNQIGTAAPAPRRRPSRSPSGAPKTAAATPAKTAGKKAAGAGKTTATRSVRKKAAAGKSAATRSATAKAAAKRSGATKAVAKKSAARRSTATKAASRKAAAKKAVAKKAVARKTVAKKAVAKKSAPKKSVAKRSAATRKSATKKSPAATTATAPKKAAAKTSIATRSTTARATADEARVEARPVPTRPPADGGRPPAGPAATRPSTDTARRPADTPAPAAPRPPQSGNGTAPSRPDPPPASAGTTNGSNGSASGPRPQADGGGAVRLPDEPPRPATVGRPERPRVVAGRPGEVPLADVPLANRAPASSSRPLADPAPAEVDPASARRARAAERSAPTVQFRSGSAAPVRAAGDQPPVRPDNDLQRPDTGGSNGAASPTARRRRQLRGR